MESSCFLEAHFLADYLAGQGSAFLLHRTELSTASEGILEHEGNPLYELLLKGVLQVDEQTQRLLRDLALATLKRGHVVEYVAAATDGDVSMLSSSVRNTSLNQCGPNASRG